LGNALKELVKRDQLVPLGKKGQGTTGENFKGVMTGQVQEEKVGHEADQDHLDGTAGEVDELLLIPCVPTPEREGKIIQTLFDPKF